VIEGGAEALSTTGRFDLATLFLVLHEIPIEVREAALAATVRALKPGGTLLIFDEAYPEDEAALRDPASAFTVIAQWFELTWGSVIWPRSKIRRAVESQGMAIEREENFSRFYIVTARKPEAGHPG
jgi:hypothetical protein